MTSNSRDLQIGVRAIVALGSNLGDVERNLHDAVRALSAIPNVRVLKVSSIVKTAPVGGPADQPVFSNAAALIETNLSPVELLHFLQEIEKDLKRVRRVFWGPRTIDLDLITYGNVVMESKELILPHPRLYWRCFVLDPVCEIAPKTIIPTSGLTFEETRRLLYWNFGAFSLVSSILRNTFRKRSARLT